jgi:tetratricopeptide (TPR) repeat protein
MYRFSGLDSLTAAVYFRAMRSSSVRTVTLVLAALGLAPAVGFGLGCGPTEQPAPTKLERATPFERDVKKRERDPNDPIRNPAIEIPSGRDGAQLPEAEIDATLAEAAEFAAIKDVAQERSLLGKCANKTPPSARCDGRLGLSMIGAKNRRATALYYLSEAAVVDDPKADAELYVRIGEALSSHSRFDAAISAMEKGIARDPSAEHLFAFGRLLSLVPDRLGDSADRIAEARSKDDRIEWLYEEAVIRGQIPVREQAEQSIALFGEYRVRAESLPAESLPALPASLEGRVMEQQQQLKLKRYPTQAEYDKAKAAASGGAAPEPEPADAEPS